MSELNGDKARFQKNRKRKLHHRQRIQTLVAGLRKRSAEDASPFVRQDLRRYLSVPNHEDMVILKALVESGKLRPVIDRKYPLHETPAVLGYIEGGHARGKVVITL